LASTPSKLRQDRILDEARHTADPVHLMRVFGITARTAMRYVSPPTPSARPSRPDSRCRIEYPMGGFCALWMEPTLAPIEASRPTPSRECDYD
jgi:hypothetical protein